MIWDVAQGREKIEFSDGNKPIQGTVMKSRGMVQENGVELNLLFSEF